MYTYIFKRYLNRNQHLSIHVDTYAHTKIFNSIKNVVFNKKCFKSPFLIKTVFCIMFALVVFKYHPAEVSLTGHALGIRICGCSLFYKRELITGRLKRSQISIQLFFSENFRKYFIFLPAFYQIMWLMKSPKNFGKLATLNI